eukprot:Blabericola_migrator_1__1031@NODE_1260_length_4956_cov_162_187768_g851_i0_p2_GENE_NODE_1260_length_4956_cov_162_187768_g851_i0NODE_1260_length_4956_cov_162_187768_g851_i0_p2_ORF_typecomplete_len728_score214_24DUF3584/PF12128_8/0_0059DUF3584/PF12128_8/0_025AIP3/PF03915_13/0_00015HOOK/PF05622_12/0_0014HOOK/PF05622_12/1_7Atg14/PF10186_9/0_012Atg14/PF10186_9/0_62Filament/PF00038_21/1_2Filament/PF00038_21/0_025Myosin_tail_1/PF01576_19/0_073Myosin_tail_1/PF01576_19/0_16GAS/PF13851_6/0_15GAS/PF13851_6/
MYTSTPTPTRSVTNSGFRGNPPSVTHQRETSEDDLRETAEGLASCLTQLGFPREVTARSILDKSTPSTAFVEMANFMLKTIEDDGGISQIDELQPVLKFLGFPGTVPMRSQWLAPGNQGRLIVTFYYWLSQLVHFDQQAFDRPEPPTSWVMDMMRDMGSVEETSELEGRQTRDQISLQGISSYLKSSGALDDPSVGNLWKEETPISASDFDLFIDTLARCDKGFLEDFWPVAQIFHCHLVKMMARQAEEDYKDLQSQMAASRAKQEMLQILRDDLKSYDTKLSTLTKDHAAADEEITTMQKAVKQMTTETADLKTQCAQRQQEINRISEDLQDIRNTITKQGMSAVEAERTRAETTNQMAKAEALQSSVGKCKMQLQDSSTQMRKAYDEYSVSWNRFVSTFVNRAPEEFPNVGMVGELVRELHAMLDQAGGGGTNKRALLRALQSMLEYGTVNAILSNQLDSAFDLGKTLDSILKMESGRVIDYLENLEKEIQEGGLREMRNSIKEIKLSRAQRERNHTVSLQKLQTQLEELEKDLNKILKDSERLEIAKSDRERSLEREVHVAKQKYEKSQRLHSAALAALDESRRGWTQQIDELTASVREHEIQSHTSFKEYQEDKKRYKECLEELQQMFKKAVTDITLGLPDEILDFFPAELRAELGLPCLDFSSGDSSEDEAVAVAMVDDEEDESLKGGDENDPMPAEPIQKTDKAVRAALRQVVGKMSKFGV